MSRVTWNWGWMTTCTLCSSRASSIVTESTRKGMSSVTTSTTECPAADQPASAGPGVTTRTAAVPCGRDCGEPVVGGQGAVQVLGAALDEVLGGDVPVVGDEEVLDLFVVGSAGALRVTRDVGGAGEQFGLVVLERGEHDLTLGPGCDGHNTGSAVDVSSTRHPVVTGPAASAMMSRMLAHTRERAPLMATSLRKELAYDASPDAVAAMLADAAFREEVLERQHVRPRLGHGRGRARWPSSRCSRPPTSRRSPGSSSGTRSSSSSGSTGARPPPPTCT